LNPIFIKILKIQRKLRKFEGTSDEVCYCLNSQQSNRISGVVFSLTLTVVMATNKSLLALLHYWTGKFGSAFLANGVAVAMAGVNTILGMILELTLPGILMVTFLIIILDLSSNFRQSS